MENAQELQEMREHIRRSVASLELCESCQRICECEQCVASESVIWLCIECALGRADGCGRVR